MLKKDLMISVVLISVLAFSSLAWSDLTGTWDAATFMSGTVRIKGHGIVEKAVREPNADEYIFNDDGTFEMTDLLLPGDWSQNGRKFFVNVDPSALELYLGEDLDGTVTVTSFRFKGTESRNGTIINGKYTLKFHFFIFDPVTEGTVNVSVVFAGERTAGLTSIQSLSERRTFSEIILEKIREAVSANAAR